MSLDLLDSPDVLVVGGGSAGASAAIAAARCGARTLLVDRLPFLGGTSTAVLDTFYGFFTPGAHATKVVGGIADDVVTELRRLGPVRTRPNTYGAGTGITYHPDLLKVAWERLVVGSGARVVLHAHVQAATVTDGSVADVTVATTAGLRRVVPRIVVDASGDADVCHHAGFGYEHAGDVHPAQTLTTTFRMVNVDVERRMRLTKEELHALMERAAAGGYALPRRDGSDHVTPADHTTATVMTRLDAVRRMADGTLVGPADPDFRTAAEMAGREQALEYARFLVDLVPGYERASIGAMSTQIGVRESRRVHGDYRVTRDDVLSARQFDDQIGLCAAPIEDHHPGTGTAWHYLPDGAAVGIPFASLVVRDAVNVLVAGRCFSATHDAHASIRSMGQCMAMGQAAGTAAALAATGGLDVRAVAAGALRERLRRDGAVVELP